MADREKESLSIPCVLDPTRRAEILEDRQRVVDHKLPTDCILDRLESTVGEKRLTELGAAADLLERFDAELESLVSGVSLPFGRLDLGQYTSRRAELEQEATPCGEIGRLLGRQQGGVEVASGQPALGVGDRQMDEVEG